VKPAKPRLDLHSCLHFLLDLYSQWTLPQDAEVYEHVRKLVENSLRSGFLPARIAGLHGVLYLLQAAPARTTTQHVQISGGSVSDEIYHIQPVAIEYIQKHIDIGSGPNSHSEEHQLVMWGLVFFLLENVEEQMMDTGLLQRCCSWP